jgi:hypothetical protein
MKPISVKYLVGKDMHGRRVFLSRTETCGWEVIVEAANQRDDRQTIMGLTPEVILAMAEAIKDAGEVKS